LKKDSKNLIIGLSFQLPSDPSKMKKDNHSHNFSALKGCDVLLVEDNKFNNLVASMMLKGAGINVTTAENGEEAIASMQNKPFSMVIMDIQMPVMDGLSATKYIRSKICSSTPIIALTENEEADEQEVLLKEGVNDVLLKPFQEGELLNLMIKWFNNKK
jgi:two-component system, sensor histidine kinase